MSDHASGREPSAFAIIAAALDEPAGRARFMRGLTLGALAGAAIVGSVLRARRVARSRRRSAGRSADATLQGSAAGSEDTMEASPD